MLYGFKNEFCFDRLQNMSFSLTDETEVIVVLLLTQ